VSGSFHGSGSICLLKGPSSTQLWPIQWGKLTTPIMAQHIPWRSARKETSLQKARDLRTACRYQAHQARSWRNSNRNIADHKARRKETH
jgi:hypothetical protein